MDELYRQQLMDHYRFPRNQGVLSSSTHQAHAENPLCGDVIDVYLQIKNQAIQAVGWVSDSCVITTATASLVSSMIIGMDVIEVQRLTLADILDKLGTRLTSSRQQCAAVVLTAIQQALKSN